MKSARRPLLLWFAAAIFIASLAACIVTIVLALQTNDEPVPIGDSLLNMPLSMERRLAP